MKKLTRNLILCGTVLSVAGVVTWWLLPFIWHRTFDNVAVYRGISLAPGTVREDFRVNYTGTYSMGIEVERKFSHSVLQCLLGIRGSELVDPTLCKDNPPVLKYSWMVSCDSGFAQAGTSDKIIGGAYANETIEVQFGDFAGRRGDHCSLTLNFREDGRKLSGADPKLRIMIELL